MTIKQWINSLPRDGWEVSRFGSLERRGQFPLDVHKPPPMHWRRFTVLFLACHGVYTTQKRERIIRKALEQQWLMK